MSHQVCLSSKAISLDDPGNRGLRGSSLQRVHSRESKVIIEAQLDRPLGAPEKRALKSAARQYGRLLNVPVTLM
jgi:hypothetical protein